MPYLSIIGIAIGGISLLQGSRNKKTLQDKISDLDSGCKSVFKFNGLIDSAKKYHDGFQILQQVVFTPLKESYEKERNHLDRLANEISKCINNIAPLYPLNSTSFERATYEADYGLLPSNIVNDLKSIPGLVSEIDNSITTYRSELGQLSLLNSSRNFGNDCHQCICSIEYSLQQGLAASDKLILNSIPMVSYINNQIEIAVQNLS